MFNFLEVLRLGGFGLGYLVVIVLGMAAGCFGFYCVKKDEESGDDWMRVTFMIFLFLVMCYFFSIPVFLNGERSKGFVIMLIIAFLSFFSMLALVRDDSKTRLGRNRNKDHVGWKLFFIGKSAVVSLLPVAFIVGDNTLFLSQLNQKQKAEWCISEKILKSDSSPKDIGKALVKIKGYDYPLSPFTGIADLKLGKISEAVKSFHDYTNSMRQEGQKKYFWLGVADYYEGNFVLASQNFELAKEPALFLLASFKSGKLEQQRLNELKKQSGQIPIVVYADEIEKTLLLKETAQKPKNKKEFEKLVWEKLNRLEKLISEKPVSQQTPVTVVSLDERINNTVFARVLAYEKAPILPKVDTDKIVWFMVSVLPVFLTTMFITNAIIRDHLWKKIQNKKWAGKISNLAEKLSWHSFIARKVSAQIALSEKEKGMFSKEIEKIQNAVFPLDVILSLFYLRKTRKILKNWEINSQEKEDIKYIYQEIKRLAGKLIPQGNEESLMVITALRKKASQIANVYLKNDINYQKGRTSLLATFDELATVGDILEARKTENQISYYSLLGIRIEAKAEEVKKAYRSVIPAVHPDHHQGNLYLQALAIIINMAYATLSNGMRREIYDKQMGF